MKQRGRKSVAALAVADTTTHLSQRPAPPADLTAIQRHHWVEIANSLPADWWKDDNKALLAEYCRTLSTLAFLNAQIDAQEALDPSQIDTQAYMEILKRRESLVRVQLTQATKMRLTQQSRYRADKASVVTSAPHSKGKTWQFGG
jgi:hypothetical protein